MTTSNYLTQLQQDREDLVDNLETKGITGLTGDETFTELVPEVLNISGGSSIDEYYNTFAEADQSGIVPSTQSASWGMTEYVIKLPDVVIDDNATNISNLFAKWTFKVAPKIIFNDNIPWLYNLFKDSTNLQSVDISGWTTSQLVGIGNCFYGCSSLTTLDFSSLQPTGLFDLYGAFYNCTSLTSLNLSGITQPKSIKEAFYGCRNLTFLDLRKMDFSGVTNSADTFTSVPANCLIIVKDQTAKTWITSKFSRMTNVKTVEEYEASLSS